MVRWVPGAPQTRQDVQAVLNEFEEIHRTIGPVIGIALVPPDLPSPEGEMRKFINQKMDNLLALSETIHYVMEGTGFKNSILRSVVTNILMLQGKRGKIFVYKDFDEAIAALTPRLQELKILPTRLSLAARSKGLLSPARAKVVESPGLFR